MALDKMNSNLEELSEEQVSEVVGGIQRGPKQQTRNNERGKKDELTRNNQRGTRVEGLTRQHKRALQIRGGDKKDEYRM